MVNRSAEEIAESAEGNIKTKHLTKDSGIVFTYLYDGPLLTYLEDGEQPEYIFSNERKGFRITDENGEKTPHHTGSEGKRYLLITDRRVLYVAGCKDGDELIEYSYDDILDIRVVDSNNIEFFTTDKKVYKFAQVGETKYTVEDAVNYASEIVGEIEHKDIDLETVKDEVGFTDSESKHGKQNNTNKKSTGSEDSSKNTTPDKYKPDTKPHSDKHKYTASDNTMNSSGPEFTTRGKKVKIEGKTRERTNCGKIEVYSDKIKIQQKGTIMSKGWITLQFDNIYDIQVSSLGKMTFMTNRKNVSVTGLGGPTGTKLLEHMRDYMQNKQNKLEKKVEKREKNMSKNSTSTNSSADKIAKFAKLKEDGVITEEEFQKKKDELL